MLLYSLSPCQHSRPRRTARNEPLSINRRTVLIERLRVADDLIQSFTKSLTAGQLPVKRQNWRTQQHGRQSVRHISLRRSKNELIKHADREMFRHHRTEPLKDQSHAAVRPGIVEV